MADTQSSPEQMAAINAQLDILRQFIRRVDRLEQSGFCRRYGTEIPNVFAKLEDVKFEKTGDAQFMESHSHA